jgi:hypothetical protein
MLIENYNKKKYLAVRSNQMHLYSPVLVQMGIEKLKPLSLFFDFNFSKAYMLNTNIQSSNETNLTLFNIM